MRADLPQTQNEQEDMLMAMERGIVSNETQCASGVSDILLQQGVVADEPVDLDLCASLKLVVELQSTFVSTQNTRNAHADTMHIAFVLGELDMDKLHMLRWEIQDGLAVLLIPRQMLVSNGSKQRRRAERYQFGVLGPPKQDRFE